MPALHPNLVRRSVIAASVAVAVAFGGCVYDPDHVCGPNQVKSPDNSDECVCVEGTVLAGGRCIACGDHEVYSGGTCQCEVGFARDTEEGPCLQTGLGSDCSAVSPCADSRYPTCHAIAGSVADAGAGGSGGAGGASGTGYCTSSGCATTADCPQGWACDTAETPTVCLMPPSGQGRPCTQQSDCAGTEATFCDTFISHVCLVRGCTVGGNDCFLGWDCCDVTPRGVPEQLCVPIGQCPT